MAEEIQFLDEELNEICLEIRKGIDELTGGRVKGDARAEKVAHLNKRLTRARQVLHSYKVELRELTPDELPQYEQKSKEYNNLISKLTNDFNFAKSAGDRDDLMGGRTTTEIDPDKMSAKEIIDTAKKVQDESKASTTRSLQKVEQAEMIGKDTATTMKQQTEQLKSIHAEVEEVESNIARAGKLVRGFMKSMATDKLVITLICLIVLGIVGIIVYQAVNNQGPFANSDQTLCNAGVTALCNEGN